MSSFIYVNNSQFSQVSDLLQQSHDRINQMKAEWDQVALGGNFEALANHLDMRDAEGNYRTADAEALYNLIGSVAAAINNPNNFVTQLLSRT